jgi:hypothetical protein
VIFDRQLLIGEDYGFLGFELVSCPQFTILGTGYLHPCGYDGS